MVKSEIPTFYRIWFTWIDPLATASGVYTNFFDPDAILNAVVPHANRNPDHDAVYMQLGAFSISLLVVQAYLLRVTQDLKVWRAVQLAVLLTELALLYVLYWGFARRGALSHSLWRMEDWGCLIITGTVTLIRTAFLLSLGFQTGSGGLAKKRH